MHDHHSISSHAGHGHHHSTSGISEKNLLAAVVLNFTITIAEIIGGILSNSLAFLSDAIHNLGDGLAVLLAYIAHRVSKRESNQRKTFGYKRIEILAAFVNSIVLVAICIFLIWEAIERFQNPAPIKGANHVCSGRHGTHCQPPGRGSAAIRFKERTSISGRPTFTCWETPCPLLWSLLEGS